MSSDTGQCGKLQAAPAKIPIFKPSTVDSDHLFFYKAKIKLEEI